MVHLLMNKWKFVDKPLLNFCLSDCLTLLATMVGQITVSWWISSHGGAKDLTLYVASVATSGLICMTLLSPLGDRYSKKTLIVTGLFAYIGGTVAMAVLASAAFYSLGWIILLGVVSTLAVTLIAPSSNNIVAEILGADKVPAGLALQQSAQSTGRLIGPVLGGGILALATISAALWLQSLLLAFAALLVLRVRFMLSTDREHGRGWWAELRSGLFAIWAVPIERGWNVVNFVSEIFLFPALTLLIPLKIQALGLTAAWLGGCEAALSIGMLGGATVGSKILVRWLGRYPTRLSGVVVEGLMLAMAGYCSSPLLLIVAFMGAGFANSTLVLVAMTHRILARPEPFRARMSSVGILVSQIADILGPLLAGLALKLWSLSIVYTSFGLLSALCGLGLILVPRVREFMTLDHTEVTGLYRRLYPHAFQSE